MTWPLICNVIAYQQPYCHPIGELIMAREKRTKAETIKAANDAHSELMSLFRRYGLPDIPEGSRMDPSGENPRVVRVLPDRLETLCEAPLGNWTAAVKVLKTLIESFEDENAKDLAASVEVENSE